MKSVYIVLVCLSMIGCKSKKNASESAVDSTVHTGIVAISKECGVIISMTENGSELKLYPVNLSEEFKKDGMKISFSSLPSRAMQPQGCSVDRVVSVENVKKIK